MTTLNGARVVITRPIDRSRELAARLEREGCVVIRAPMISIEAVNHPAIADFLNNIASFDLVVFNSANAVARVLSPDVVQQWPERLQIAAVGPATAQAVENAQLHATVLNEGVTGADLVRALPDISGKTVFLPRGDRSDGQIEQLLSAAGAHVRTAIVYLTHDTEPAPDVRDALGRGMDAIVFYSPSAVQRLGALGLDTRQVSMVCVGPTTAVAAAKLANARIITARDTSVDAMVDAVAEALNGGDQHVE